MYSLREKILIGLWGVTLLCLFATTSAYHPGEKVYKTSSTIAMIHLSSDIVVGEDNESSFDIQDDIAAWEEDFSISSVDIDGEVVQEKPTRIESVEYHEMNDPQNMVYHELNDPNNVLYHEMNDPQNMVYHELNDPNSLEYHEMNDPKNEYALNLEMEEQMVQLVEDVIDLDEILNEF